MRLVRACQILKKLSISTETYLQHIKSLPPKVPISVYGYCFTTRIVAHLRYRGGRPSHALGTVCPSGLKRNDLRPNWLRHLRPTANSDDVVQRTPPKKHDTQNPPDTAVNVLKQTRACHPLCLSELSRFRRPQHRRTSTPNGIHFWNAVFATVK